VQTAAIRALAPFVVGRPLGATNLHLGLLVSSSSRPVGLMTPETAGSRRSAVAFAA
jgi:hypothetical protein